jgi:uncharacterized protein
MIEYRLIGLSLIVGLGACSSVPVHFYTLVGKDPQASQAAPVIPASIDVRIRHLPPQLNRPELVIRRGDNELVVLENERWGAPLHDELRDALRFALQSDQNPTNDFRSAGTFEIIVDIDRMDAELDQVVVLDATWNAPDLMRCAVHTVEDIGAGYSAMVDGYQRAIRKLSHAIAYALSTHQCQ